LLHETADRALTTAGNVLNAASQVVSNAGNASIQYSLIRNRKTCGTLSLAGSSSSTVGWLGLNLDFLEAARNLSEDCNTDLTYSLQSPAKMYQMKNSSWRGPAAPALSLLTCIHRQEPRTKTGYSQQSCCNAKSTKRKRSYG
jgi:hypothetical protein